MASLDLTFDDVLGRKKRQRREQEVAQLTQNLMQQGKLTPEEINSVAKNYLNNGDIKIPTARGRMLGPDEVQADPDLPQRSTLEPIQFDKRKQVYAMDKSSGAFKDVAGNPVLNIPDNVEPQVHAYNEPNTREGHAWRIDSATGKREDMGSNGKTYDSYVNWNSKTGQGGKDGRGSKPPDVVLMEDTIKKYQDAKKTGKPMTPEFIDSAKSAFDGLGIPFQEADLPPAGFDKVRNAISKATGGYVAPAIVQKGDPVPNFDKSAAAKRNKAIQWLNQHRAKVTDANIEAVLKQGKVD